MNVLAPYTGNTNALKFIYKQAVKLYEEYEEHTHNMIKSITTCFDNDLLIDSEMDGVQIGYLPIEVYTQFKDKVLLPVDKD